MRENFLKLAKLLFPICRSITGNGLRKTLKIIKTIHLKNLKVIEVKSGTQVFDWKIPSEWNVKDAYILNKDKKKIVDFKKNNLHLVSYSNPLSGYIEKKKLLRNLHSLPHMPNAIPYVTSYYKKYWGFCLSHKQKKQIIRSKDKKYFVKIDTNFNSKGSLTYGEFFIKGRSKKEILITTYICHPSMANNEISGPVISTFLAKEFKKRKNFYSLRFIFVPETIGAITYISKNFQNLKKNVIAGYNLTCIGDERKYSYLPTKYGNTLSDKAAKKAFKELKIKFKKYSFLDRGSDERQFNSPGVDLPIGSIMRSKYETYKEYHTSLDNFNLVTEKGLKGSYKVVKKSIEILQNNRVPFSNIICEPQMSRRGLYPSLSNNKRSNFTKNLMSFLIYCDGKNDLINISNYLGISFNKTKKIYDILIKNKIISV